MTSIDTQAAEIKIRDRLLDALTVSSGAVDAISFIAFGRVFTAFMTGNIAFLGLRIAGEDTVPGYAPLLASLVCFGLGVYLGTQVVAPTKASGTWPRGVTLVLGLSLIFHAGSLVVWFAIDGQPNGHTAPVLLALWGIAMGMQSAAVRALKVDAVYTTAATAAVMFLAADIATWPATAAERRRLLTVILSLVVGATAGGFLLVRGHIYAPLLPFVITIGVVVIAVRVFGRASSTRSAGVTSQPLTR